MAAECAERLTRIGMPENSFSMETLPKPHVETDFSEQIRAASRAKYSRSLDDLQPPEPEAEVHKPAHAQPEPQEPELTESGFTDSDMVEEPEPEKPTPEATEKPEATPKPQQEKKIDFFE